ncbi:hypothetical protein X773_09105 [Mesorhizobium sp. LSJC285A00]|nr:hypothetical protein X773_09105 [Mesorhizobium sp. LSJC285A00]ESX09128.1 hypothetical protein X768_19865 [Mesorhizobium sp. LSJC265A00]
MRRIAARQPLGPPADYPLWASDLEKQALE